MLLSFLIHGNLWEYNVLHIFLKFRKFRTCKSFKFDNFHHKYHSQKYILSKFLQISILFKRNFYDIVLKVQITQIWKCLQKLLKYFWNNLQLLKLILGLRLNIAIKGKWPFLPEQNRLLFKFVFQETFKIFLCKIQILIKKPWDLILGKLLCYHKCKILIPAKFYFWLVQPENLNKTPWRSTRKIIYVESDYKHYFVN